MDREAVPGGNISPGEDSILELNREAQKAWADVPIVDKPDGVHSKNPSLFDLHEDMQTVDAIPVDELNKRVKAEGDELLEEVFRKESPDEKFHFDNA